MPADIAELTLAAAAEGVAKKEFTSEELVRGVIAAIAEKDGALGAYLSFDAEGALGAARLADARVAAGEGAPLLGVPLAIKDLFNVAGQPCGCASKIMEGYVAKYDAGVIRRIKGAGAIPAGRVNMDEFAMGVTTEHSAYKVTRNPRNLSRVPGGSSGGSAAAVAGGVALASLASDTGGSIRQPAAFCGCVGLKPSYGRVSRFGAASFASSLDQAGTMTKTVEDAALLLGVIAGADENDHTALDAPVPDYRTALAGASLKGLRIGMPREYFTFGADAEVMEKVRAAVALCESAGAQVREISLPHTQYAVGVYQICSTAEASANLARFDGVRYGARRGAPEGGIGEMYDRTRSEGFGEEVKRRIILGTYVLSSGYYDAYYNRALKARTLIRRDFEAAFAGCDIIAAPVAPTCAYELNSTVNDPLRSYLGDIFTVSANLAGVCAISVPCGVNSEGLPVGLQLIGPALGETALLRAAKAYEDARG